MTRVGKTARLLLAITGLITMSGLATYAIGLDRQALWQVVQACVADFKLTTAPFPCLEVNLTGGEEGGDVVLRPPLTRDMILSPTRRSSASRTGFYSPPVRRIISTPRGGRDPFSPTPEGVRQIVRRLHSSSTPPSFEPRINSTSMWAAFFRPFKGRSRQSRPKSRSGSGNGSAP